MANRLPPGELVAKLFWAGLSFDDVALAVSAILKRQWFRLDCENAFRTYVNRRKREGRHV